MNAIEKLKKLNGKMPICAYCPPNPKIDWNGELRETQITDKYYKLMADSGVNIVYGHEESIGTERESEVFVALDLCQKYGMIYLVKDSIFKEFISLGNNGFKALKELSYVEREDLKSRYIASIAKYKNHSAFGGVEFIDEPGLSMMQGIAFAQGIFREQCPDKLFYLNMYPSWVYDFQLQYGPDSKGFTELEEGLKDKNRITRYDYFIDRYIKIVNPELLSYDAYPVLTLGEFTDMVHSALFEHLAVANRVMHEYNIPFFNFIQAGGKWEGCAHVRVPTEAEIGLQINTSLSYGAKGLQIFPYQYPSAWAADNETIAGLVDRDGNKTVFYEYFQKILAHVQACAQVLMAAKFEKLIVAGECKGYDMQKVLAVKDCDCIFNGNIPLGSADTSYKKIIHMAASNRVIVGCFDHNTDSALYFTNVSTALSAQITVYSMVGISGYMIANGNKQEFDSKEISFALKPGQGILFYVKKG